MEFMLKSAIPMTDKIAGTPDRDRGKDYNHSTFIDLIIEGLVGLRALLGSLLIVQPLADPEVVNYFALDNVLYHGKNLSVIWDPEGTQWPKVGCKGFCVYIDGKQEASAGSLGRVQIQL